MIETLSFYNYQYRKDIIDKFNISSIEELQLPLQLRVTKRVKLPRSRRRNVKRSRLLYLKSVLELITGQACGIRKIKRHRRVKSGVKINRRHYFYFFYCDLINTRLIFNFINLLYCVAQIKILRLKFHFVKKLQGNELCTLSKLKEKYIVIVPRYKKLKKRSKIRVVFSLYKNHKNFLPDIIQKTKHFLLYFFFKRLNLVKSIKKRRKFKFDY